MLAFSFLFPVATENAYAQDCNDPINGCSPDEGSNEEEDEEQHNGNNCPICAQIEAALGDMLDEYYYYEDGTPGPGTTEAEDQLLVDGEEAQVAALTDPDGLEADLRSAEVIVNDGTTAYDSVVAYSDEYADVVADSGSSANSSQAGDPNLLATGTLLVEETDLAFPIGSMLVTVSRTHRSDRAQWSSFGDCWFFSYDTRIILGTSPGMTSLGSRLSSDSVGLRCLAAARDQQIEVLMGRVADILDERVRPRRSDAESQLLACEELYEQVSELPSSGDRTRLLEEAGDLIESLRVTFTAYDNMAAALERSQATLESLRSNSEVIGQIGDLADELAGMAEEARTIGIVSASNEGKNRLSWHTQDPAAYSRSGVGTATFIDSTGLPHLYRFDRAPALVNGGPTRLYADGSANYYPAGANLLPDRPADPELVLTEQGAWEVFYRDGRVGRYGVDGLLSELSDRNGNTVHIRRDPSGRVVQLVDDRGRRVELLGDGDRITAVSDPLGRTTQYGYDDAGRLTSVTDPVGDSVTYAYAENRLSSIGKPDGSHIDYTYVLHAGRMVLATTTDEERNRESFQYGNGYTVHTNPSGIRTTHYFDEHCREVRVTNMDGSSRTKRYDDRGHLVEEVDEEGNATRYERDRAGYPVRTIYADGSSERCTFNRLGMPLESVDGRGAVIRRTYDAAGNLVEVQYPDGSRTSYTYDARGNLLSETDELGRASRYGYDSNGYLSFATDPTGSTRRYEYDVVGRCTSVTDSEGGVTTFEYRPDGLLSAYTDAAGARELYRYDNRKNLVVRVDRCGNAIHYTYDLRHLCVATTDSEGRTHRFRYRADGRLAELTLPGGATVTYSYDERGKLSSLLENETESPRRYRRDKAGRVSGSVDPNGGEWSFRRDGRGRIIASVDPLGGSQLFEYDPNSNLRARTDELGNRTDYTYDARNRLIRLQYPTGDEVRFSYYPSGSIAALRSDNGAVTTYRYDACDRLVEVRDALEGVTRYGYSPSGRLTSLTDPAGHTTQVAYDLAGRPSKVVDPLGGTLLLRHDRMGRLLAVTDQLARTTSYAYDTVGRLTELRSPSGRVTRLTYGPSDNPLSLTDPSGGQRSFSYDAAGHLRSRTGPRGELERFRYDAGGNLISYLDPGGAETQFIYDLLGRLTARIRPDGTRTRWIFDPAGNLLSECDPLGRDHRWEYDARNRVVRETDHAGNHRLYRYEAGNLVEERGFAGDPIRYRYDPLRRLVDIGYSDGSSAAFAYDAIGNLTSATNQVCEYRFAYDPARRLIRSSTSLNPNDIEYSYDPVGNLVEVRHTANQARIQYDYDEENKLVRIRDPSGGLTRFDYDSLGREVSRRLPNSVVERRSYDASGHPRSIVVRSPVTAPSGMPGNAVTGRGYLCDDNGRRRYTVDHDGSVTSYRYDSLGRLAEVAYPASRTELLTASLRSLGLPAPLPSALEPVEADYLSLSPADEQAIRSLLDQSLPLSRILFNPQQKVVRVSYRYDDAGNRIAETTPWGTVKYSYGLNNEILSAGTRSYTSDPAGNLTGERNGQASVSYSYAPNGRLQTVSFSDPLTGELTRKTDAADRPRSIRYRYDPFGRRVGRTVYSAPASPTTSQTDGTLFAATTWFQYDRLGFDRIASWSASPERTTATRLKLEPTVGTRYRYLGNRTPSLTAGADGATLGLRLLASCGLLQIPGPDGPLYLSQDPARSVITVTDQTGRPAAPIISTPFGRLTDTVIDQTTSPGFAGKDLDPYTRFYDFGMRDYYPLLGRWTTPDPIMAGTNWYAYTENDPINFTDPTGLLLMSVTKTYYQDRNPRDERPQRYAEMPIGHFAKDTDPDLRSSPETIGNAGCLLTAATRIANSLNRNENISPETANRVANVKDLYVPAASGQIDELTPESTA